MPWIASAVSTTNDDDSTITNKTLKLVQVYTQYKKRQVIPERMIRSMMLLSRNIRISRNRMTLTDKSRRWTKSKKSSTVLVKQKEPS